MEETGSLRRRRGRNNSDAEVGAPERPLGRQQQVLLELVVVLLRLDLIAFWILAFTKRLTDQERRDNISPHFDELWDRGHRVQPSAKEIETWLESDHLFPPYTDVNIPGFRAYITKLLEIEIEDHIHQIVANASRKSIIFYHRMMRELRSRLEDEDYVYEQMQKDLNQAYLLNIGFLHQQRPRDTNDYRQQIFHNRGTVRDKLTGCLNAVRELFDQLEKADNANALDKELRLSMQVVGKSLIAPFNNAVTMVEKGGEYHGGLLSANAHSWLSTDRPRLVLEWEAIKGSVVAAFLIYMMAFFPALDQFAKSAPGPGVCPDANFSGMTSSAVLQLLTCLLAALGLWSPQLLGLPPPRPPGLLIYLVGALSLLFTLLSLLVYCVLSAAWAGVLSFSGQALMALLSLLLLFAS